MHVMKNKQSSQMRVSGSEEAEDDQSSANAIPLRQSIIVWPGKKQLHMVNLECQ